MTIRYPFTLHVGRPSHTRNGSPRSWKDHRDLRHVTLHFDAAGHLSDACAGTWARSIALERWGEINGQYRLRAGGLPGPVWWFSCGGHGGYLLIVPPTAVPPFFAQFCEDGSPHWTDADRYPPIAVYAFEEDCNWAVLLATYPAAAIAEARTSPRRRIGPGGQPLWGYIVDSIRAWNPDLLDSLLLRPALPAGPLITSTS